jgi:hypothetical protein
MDTTERTLIDTLFDKVAAVEDRSGGRDEEAEAHILARVARRPAAPYYLAQTVIVQEQALAAAEARIEHLERQLSERPSGGFLFGLFGGGLFESAAPRGLAAGRGPACDPRVAAFADPRDRQGGGFLAGAAQTALGVTGGVLLGSILSGLFPPEQAVAAESLLGEADDDEAETETGAAAPGAPTTAADAEDGDRG